MAAEITPFAFPATGQPVRTVMVDGQPWIFANDVCAVLEIANVGNALARLDEDEKSSIRLTDGTLGNPNRAIINEAGLYSLVLRSDKPEAKTFRRWVTHDVLPTIGRTGSYSAAPVLPQDYEEALAALLAKVRDNKALLAENAELKPSAHAWNVLASGDGDYSVADAAKILSRDPDIDCGRDRLFAFLENIRWIYRQRSDYRRRAFQAHVDNGRLSELPQQYENSKTGELTLGAPQVRVKLKGLRELHKRLGGAAALELPEQVS